MYRGIKVLVILSLICMSVNAVPPDYDEATCIGIEDGILRQITGYCTYYYFCEAEIGYLEDCKAYGDFQFDATTGTCEPPEYVNCVEEPEYPEYPEYPDPETQAPVQPTLPPAVQTTAIAITTPLDSNGITDVVCPTNRPGEILFFESLNCTEYYICANGVKLTMKCIDGFVFNPDDKQCDHPVYNPRCSNLSFDPNRNVKCNRHGFYTAPYPLDCTKYVFCAEGIPIIQQCPIGTGWHIDRCIAKKHTLCADPAKVRY
ncbi:unnamed protein product [Chironomus riparius]|uniref:Chitin-binding type-2 domain-containing protein n=1 Tax=Chironomus riparius TaxID=315576 RepID=A0A9N9WSC6_9DIPT|nr:unnamed protein product [Chironomus riparius]